MEDRLYDLLTERFDRLDDSVSRLEGRQWAQNELLLQHVSSDTGHSVVQEVKDQQSSFKRFIIYTSAVVAGFSTALGIWVKFG